MKMNLLFILSLLFVVSCGDMFMSKKKNNQTDMSEFAACAMDTDSFAQILTKDISYELFCLEQNLKLFIKVVKTDKPGYLSKNKLNTYLKNNFKGLDSTILNAIEVLFQLGHLTFGDEQNYISNKNIHKITKFLIEVNKIAVKSQLEEVFFNESLIGYEEHFKNRSKLYFAFNDIAKKFSEIYVEGNKERAISFEKFISLFRTQLTSASLNKLEKFLFVKRILVGGDKKVLTSSELKTLMAQSPILLKIFFDFNQFQYITTSGQDKISEFQIYKEDIINLSEVMYRPKNKDEVLFTVDEAIEAIQEVTKDVFDVAKFRNAIGKAKKILLGNPDDQESDNFVIADMNQAIAHASYLLDKGIFFYKTYESHKKSMAMTTPITQYLSSKGSITLEEYEFEKDFNRVISKYRFFMGDFLVPYFADTYHRNAKGTVEVMALEYIFAIVMKHYGVADSKAVGGYKTSYELLKKGLLDFEDVLVENKILLPERAASSAETLALMTTLFQYQSDGDDYIHVPELTEFVISVFAAASMGDVFAKEMPKYCNPTSSGKVDATCFRENFYKVFKMKLANGKTFADYLPRLDSFLRKQDSAQLDHFLKETEWFTRVCTEFESGEEVPLQKEDYLVFFGGMLTLEQTMSRFDRNQNNLLDKEEVLEAYTVYAPAIKALVPVDILKGMSKQFFLYLVKYKKLPNVEGVKNIKDFFRAVKEGGHFLAFLTRFDKVSTADRVTMATILKTLSLMSPESLENPYDCESLR
jgi:hypothetical protein